MSVIEEKNYFLPTRQIKDDDGFKIRALLMARKVSGTGFIGVADRLPRATCAL
jgi:hypothetical protein